MTRSIHLAILVSIIFGAVPSLRGQNAPPRFEAAVSYSAVRSSGSANACNCFWMQGGKAEFSAALTRGFSIVGEFAAQHASDINSAGEDFGLATYLFGPRYSYRSGRRVTPFGQILFGGVHGFDAYFPAPNTPTTTATNPNAFAMTAGGGFNVKVSRRLAVRPLQVDFLRTQLPNDETNVENSLRLGAGVVFAIGSQK